jgi:hypothetical protein
MFYRVPAAILTAALAVPAIPASSETIPSDPPARAERPSRLLTIGRAYTVEARGCETKTTHFHVTAIQPIDRTRAEKSPTLSGVFFRSRELTGQAGWRNVGYSTDGRSIEFDLWAEGAGTPENGPGTARCESPAIARAVIDIDAWVLD